MTGRRLYLDHVASAPLAAAAREALVEALSFIGNPSSAHEEGRRARDALEAARRRVAAVLGTRPREVVFTSGGTEASQMAVRGLARASRGSSRRVVTGAVEHPAVLDAVRDLATDGFEVVEVPPDADGRIDPADFLAAAAPGAALAALMAANHETGALMPVREVGDRLRALGIPLVCDACLAPGRVGVARGDLDVDALVLSAHKFGGPKGMGCLVLRRGTRMDPLWSGGVQEEKLRPGTEDVAGAVGLAVALEAAVAATAERAARYAHLLDHVLDGLGPEMGVRLVGPPAGRLPGVATLELAGIEGEAAMINLDLDGVAVSTGSACALGAAEPSPTLLAMGLGRRRAASTIRVSVGEGLSEDDAKDANRRIVAVVDRLRALSRP